MASKSTTKRARFSMGGTALESREQRANYANDLANLITSGAAHGMLRRAYQERGKALYGNMLKQHAAKRAEFHKFAQQIADGKLTLSTPEEIKQYNELTLRYGGPTAADVHIDTLATDLLADYAQSPFIAPLVMPFYQVAKRSGKLQLLSRRAGKNAAYDDTRAPGAPAKQMDWAIGTPANYSVDSRGLKLPIPDEVTENEDDPIRVAELGARYVQETVMLKHEKRVATIVQTASNYLSAHRITAPSVKWDAVDTSDNEHLDDIQNAHRLIVAATGRSANTFVCNLQTAHALVRKDDFRDRVKYVQKVMDSTLLSEIGAYVGVDNVCIGLATEDTANPAATASYSAVWTDYPALLCVEQPSLSFTGFGLCPVTDPGTVVRFRDPDMTAKADIVGFLLDVDEVVVQNDAGAIFQDVLT